MTKSVTKIQDKDTRKRLSVVRSIEDPTKYGVVILNPDGSKISGPKGDPGPAGPSICSAEFNGDDIDFGRSDGCTVKLEDAKMCLQGPTGNGICCTTCSKAGKTTTIQFDYTNGTDFCFNVQDGQDGIGSGDMLKCVYDPNNCEKNVFDYNNLDNKPSIPTDNCQLGNGCGYTTCMGTLVPSDLSGYAKCCDIPTDNCQLANGCGYLKSCDLGSYAKCCDIPTDNCELSNGCGYITGINCGDVTSALGYTPYNSTNPSGYTSCTGTLVPSDLNNYAKCCDIPTDNCQLSNGCGYTKCTGNVSTCADIINRLGYTPYNSTNPSGYTTCTGTLKSSDIACINGCCLTNGGDICIKSGGSSGPKIDLLVVGGGGGGGAGGGNRTGGGGGGGGGTILKIGLYLENSNYNVVVGTGGNSVGYGQGDACSGTASCFGDIVALGGTGGKDPFQIGCGNGGNSGGLGLGGWSNGATCSGGGGGGGSNGNGMIGYTYPGNGGAGLYSDISGNFVGYGGGGGGGTGYGKPPSCGCYGLGNSGGGCGGDCACGACCGINGGGGGGGYGTGSGAKGGNGVVIIRYINNGDCGINCATGGTVYCCNGYVIHCFTSDGVFCIVE